MSNIKFGRTYRLTINLNDGSEPIIVTLPFTIQFTINRKTFASLNTCYVDVYNLSPRIRELIFQEPFIAKNKTMTLEAGYGELVKIFEGTIFQASSARDGTNVITSIECLSGNWQINQTTVYTSLTKGQTLGDIFKFLSGQFPDLTIGAIGDFPQKLERPVALNGNAWDIFKRYSGNSVAIDNQRIYVLNRNEVVEGDILFLNEDTGLLQTPTRAGGFITVPVLFEPRVKLQQQMQLESKVNPIYNGTYKVAGLQHEAIISESVSGHARTMIDLFVGAQTFQTVRENG